MVDLTLSEEQEMLKELAHEFEPGCKAEVTLHLLGKVLEKAAGELEKASAELAEEVFGDIEGTP